MSGPNLNIMKAPGSFRAGIWRGGVLQIKVTNVCDLDCKNCSVGVGLARKLKRVFRMTPANFRLACQSLKGYHGVIGMFGGNPCLHPDFEELCEIFREEVPNQDQRGLWSNNLRGHGATCRKTFSPVHSNLNVHQVQAAWDEIKTMWPEARPIQSGLTAPSHHGPIFGSMMEMGLSADDMWRRVGACYVNQTWSAEITQLNGKLAAFFCEIAASMAELEGDASRALAVYPGWWQLSMDSFEGQVHSYCTRCLVPFNPRKIDAAGTAPEEYTQTWAPVIATINGRPMRQVGAAEASELRSNQPATKYLPTGVMPART